MTYIFINESFKDVRILRLYKYIKKTRNTPEVECLEVGYSSDRPPPRARRPLGETTAAGLSPAELGRRTITRRDGRAIISVRYRTLAPR